MEIKILSSAEIKLYRFFVKVFDGIDWAKNWLEGVDLWGYWKEGDSFVFKSGTKHICISRPFLKELLNKTEK